MSLLKCVVYLVLLAVPNVLCALNIRGGVSSILQGAFSNLNNLNNNNNNNNNALSNINNRIRDTFMVGVLNGRNTACNGTGQFAGREGVCKPTKECTAQGGTASGSCSLVGSCCILDLSCGNTTSEKVSYFTYSGVENIQPVCAFGIRPFSTNVCQIRLDFERFAIEQPDVLQLCTVDSFAVNGVLDNIGFRTLCGNNDGQHIYLQVESVTGGTVMLNNIMLQFNLQSNRTGLTVQNPRWRIKITQLECNSFVKNHTTIQSTLTSMYQKHQNKQSTIEDDRRLIAPRGCLQYYPEPTGRYESFNYNNGAGPMPANMEYSICFRRSPSVCGVRHTADTFLMANELIASSCLSAVPPLATDVQNYLFIPISTKAPTAVADPNVPDYYCEDSLQNQVVTSRTTGPLYVTVRTDANQDPLLLGTSNVGFRINYQVFTCSSGL